MESKKSYKAIFMNNYYNLAPDVEVWFLYNIPEWLKDGTVLNLHIGDKNPIDIPILSAVVDDCKMILYKKGELYKHIAVPYRRNELGHCVIDLDEVLNQHEIEYQHIELSNNELETEIYEVFADDEGYAYVKLSEVTEGLTAYLLTVCFAPEAKTIFKPGTDQVTTRIWSPGDYSSDISSYMNWIFMKDNTER